MGVGVGVGVAIISCCLACVHSGGDTDSMRVKPLRSSKAPMAVAAHTMLAQLTAEESALASEQRIELKKRRAGLESVLWQSGQFF